MAVNFAVVAKAIIEYACVSAPELRGLNALNVSDVSRRMTLQARMYLSGRFVKQMSTTGVVVHRLEQYNPATPLQELSGVVRASWLRADLPFCSYQASVPGIGWLVDDPRPANMGPAFPHDVWGVLARGSEFRKSHWVYNSTSSKSIKLKASQPECDNTSNKVEAYAEARLSWWDRASCCNDTKGVFQRSLAFARHPGMSCWKRNWDAMADRVRAYVARLARAANKATFVRKGTSALYNEVFFHVHPVDVSVVFYTNHTTRTENRPAWAPGELHDRLRLARLSLRHAVRTAYEIADRTSGAGRLKLHRGSPHLSLLQGPYSPRILQLIVADLECVDAASVIKRIRNGYAIPRSRLNLSTFAALEPPPVAELEAVIAQQL